ncbi:hypothetical protein FBEOM_4473 [Fusarium beomiforme]|uniref:BHLH domain-containing protein n=1 Tax=Fusarium beomiforme TaxID=44412 RepID=A0A9P5AMQ6_9HYPO|nr:hypothetical protein FBEOM_4473 [Fusarium beomiforme]
MLTHPVTTAAAQNLPWDVDEYLPSEYFSNTSSSPELADYVQADYPFDYIPSPETTAPFEPDIQSQRRSRGECLTMTGLQNPRSTDLQPSDNLSNIPDIKLRAASQKPKNRRQPLISKNPAHVRECHNLVEKQYRNRLKVQFEMLLAVLPASQTLTLANRESISSSGQILSKGQVLDLARERILELEEEIASLLNMMSAGNTMV